MLALCTVPYHPPSSVLSCLFGMDKISYRHHRLFSGDKDNRNSYLHMEERSCPPGALWDTHKYSNQRFYSTGGDTKTLPGSKPIVDNSYMIPSMILLSKLTIIALAGYRHNKIVGGVPIAAAASSEKDGESNKELVTFPCPVLSMSYMAHYLTGTTANGSDSVGMHDGDRDGLGINPPVVSTYSSHCDVYYNFITTLTGNEECYGSACNQNGNDKMSSSIGHSHADRIMSIMQSACLRVKPVSFYPDKFASVDGNLDEVEVLWLETSKVLADIVLSPVNNSAAEVALYCLQVSQFVAATGCLRSLNVASENCNIIIN